MRVAAILAAVTFASTSLAAASPASDTGSGPAVEAAAPVTNAPAPPADAAGGDAAGPAPGGTPAAVDEAPSQPAPVVPTLFVDLNLTTQTMTVSAGGRQLHRWRISSGREGHRTPVGSFRAQWMSRMWYSRQYDMAPMPHSVFFKNGSAIHGTAAVSDLGLPASHGCVRLAPGNAATFFGLVSRHGLAQTSITVHGRPPALPAYVAARLRAEDAGRGRSYSGYDIGFGFPLFWGSQTAGTGYRQNSYRSERVPLRRR